MNLPDDLKYNKDYSWVKIEGNTAIVGIVEPAAKKAKEFVFIKLPEKSSKIKKGEKYVSLEASKWSGNLSSPVSGEIIDVNKPLFNEPSKINKKPYQSWIVKVKLENKEDIKELMNSKKAVNFYGSKTKPEGLK